MDIVVNILLFVLILGVIILVHEGGHFIFAKLMGVYVYEFALGMGPKIWGFKKGETEYNIRAIPIGGFCQLAGEDLDDDEDKKIPKEKRLYSKKAWQRFLIMFFGPMNNFILAILIIFGLSLVFGGTTMAPVVTAVEEGSAVEKVGMEAGDTILKINGHKVVTSDDISLYLAVANPKKKNTIVVLKEDGTRETYQVKPNKVVKDEKESYIYGIRIEQERTKGFTNAVIYTFKRVCSIFKQMFVTVVCLFTGGVRFFKQLSGPVGIYSIVGEQKSAGFANLLSLTALLSINVGFLNLLPIPAFDGGHILFIVIEKIKGSPVNPELENKIHTAFLILLMVLMLVITAQDIIKLFH